MEEAWERLEVAVPGVFGAARTLGILRQARVVEGLLGDRPSVFLGELLGQVSGDLEVAAAPAVVTFAAEVTLFAVMEERASRPTPGWRAREAEAAAKRARSVESVPDALPSLRLAKVPARTFPLRGRRTRSGVGSASLSAQDSSEESRWARRFGTLLRAAGAPSLVAAERASTPEAGIRALIGAARSGTVRLRVRAWEPFARWLGSVHGRPWPSSVGDLVEYIHVRVVEGAAESWPDIFGASVFWVEARAGYDLTFSKDPILVRTLEWAKGQLASEGRVVQKAMRFPVVIWVALEILVCDEDAELTVRVWAWVRLLKLWGVLRWDDLQRLRPDMTELRESGLVSRLLRTKTSGVNKKVGELPVFVPVAAALSGCPWLAVGYELWQACGVRSRDFFVPRASLDLCGFGGKAATAADAAHFGFLVLCRLRVPVRGSWALGVWGPGGARLLSVPLCYGWSGHSERATLPSALAAIGVEKSRRDLLGRWRPDGSDHYVRTYKAGVRDLVESLREVLASGEAWTRLDEEDIGHDLLSKVSGRFGSEAEASSAVGAFVDVSKEVCRGLRMEVGSEVLPGRSLPPPAPVEDIPASEENLMEKEFIVAYTRGRRRAVLHRVVGCWRARRGEFLDSAYFDAGDLTDTLYNSVCLVCFKADVRAEIDDLGGFSSSSSGSSGSSSE